MIAAHLNATDAMAWQLLSRGGVILLPTDTVWGLACDFENPLALKKLYGLKRAEPRQTALLFSDMDQLDDLEIRLAGSAKKLAARFWPGALTIVVPADSPRLDLVAGPDKTIGLRLPDCFRLQRLIRGYGRPLAASSANFTGSKPPCALADIPSSIVSGVDAVIESETRTSGIASAVVKCVGDGWRYLRVGAISESDVCQAVESDA